MPHTKEVALFCIVMLESFVLTAKLCLRPRLSKMEDNLLHVWNISCAQQ
jgi:hypothetical protein